MALVALALLACSLPSLVLAQKAPVGWEFQVNSYTTGSQGGYYDRVGVTGRGGVLSRPELPLEAPVTVQFQASNGNCWEARYDAID